MPMDDYDVGHTADYNVIMNVYQDSNIKSILDKFFSDNKFRDTDLQHKHNNYLIENVTMLVVRLRNALDILDSRTVTNIGGRVFHTVFPEKYDRDLGFRPMCQKPYLIQVWSGIDPKNEIIFD